MSNITPFSVIYTLHFLQCYDPTGDAFTRQAGKNLVNENLDGFQDAAIRIGL